MTEKLSELLRSIESLVGGANVTRFQSSGTWGLSPSLVVRPGSAAEAAQCLAACARLRASVIPAGFMTWLECGNPVCRADVVLSLERMRRILDYSPADLTATVEAGLSLREFNDLAKRERQWLPFNPPGSMASLGAIAACNSSGPLRLGFGTPRDYVIGLRLAHADGSESRCGGRVVKNVAGYDMNKLYVGSYGTLAAITEVTFKLRPLPESDTTIVIAKAGPSSFEFAKRVFESELQPSSLFLVEGLIDDIVRFEYSRDLTLVRLADNEAAVKHQVDWITREAGSDSAVLGKAQSEAAWGRIVDIDSLKTTAIRISVPVSTLESVLDKMSAVAELIAVDVGLGIIRIGFDQDDETAIRTISQLRETLLEVGGTLFVERSTPVVRQRIDAWGDPGAAASLMRAVKAKFDPDAILAPGRFVAGI